MIYMGSLCWLLVCACWLLAEVWTQRKRHEAVEAGIARFAARRWGVK